VILRGLVIENRAWCRVLEFAEEFGITAFFSPFALGERRGGRGGSPRPDLSQLKAPQRQV